MKLSSSSRSESPLENEEDIMDTMAKVFVKFFS